MLWTVNCKLQSWISFKLPFFFCSFTNPISFFIVFVQRTHFAVSRKLINKFITQKKKIGIIHQVVSGGGKIKGKKSREKNEFLREKKNKFHIIHKCIKLMQLTRLNVNGCPAFKFIVKAVFDPISNNTQVVNNFGNF